MLTILGPDGAPILPTIAGITPTPGQGRALAAVERLHKAKEGGVQLVGYAGTGKTTIIRALGQLYGDPKVVAPTGKAALRVTEQTGLPCSTFHRWLYDPGNDEVTGTLRLVLKHSSRLSLPSCKLVIMDESSMVSASAWADMWRTCQRLGLKIILVGDGFQLPPVERNESAGPPFSTMSPDFAKGLGFERVEMTDIVRQAQDSPVVRAAAGLRAGDRTALNLLPKVPEDALASTAHRTLTAGGVIIAHTNRTRHMANAALKQPELTENEPLLVLRNDYDLDVYNGQQLRFKRWVSTDYPAVVVADKWRTNQPTPVRFYPADVEGNRVLLCPEQIGGHLDIGEIPLGDAARRFARNNGLRCDSNEQLSMPLLHSNYGYCYTAHKAQGSEWPFVLVILERTVRLNEEEGLRFAYTAITRAQSMAAIYWGTPS